MAERTQAEKDFIDRWARLLLVKWAEFQVRTDLAMPIVPREQVYIDHARAKGWISKDGSRVLAKGFAVATSCLKGGGGGFTFSPGA